MASWQLCWDRAEVHGDGKVSKARTMTKALSGVMLMRGMKAQNTKAAASGSSSVDGALMEGFGSRGAHTQPKGTGLNWTGGKEGGRDPASRGSGRNDEVAK